MIMMGRRWVSLVRKIRHFLVEPLFEPGTIPSKEKAD